ncbi:hypothetical protein GOD78_30335 [Sinorhizobium medicae]|uniref:hypothetical protein n=1 Tax=Sinorhizobium medicae TaxID=110321 RepID=UPI000FD90DA6|nr:hypothetical protein [Sinorhizobium medicae]MDX0605402.1 hypothetical protein [Sinorhizobium medicae]MDX0766447.1 hypothetical protein [Sinorhizobium medicae]MDX0821667.1 hypothetical protein [Sinorhizobium medicae]MDX0864740.1 hypothetical protein [Sinorhizobium medicae]
MTTENIMPQVSAATHEAAFAWKQVGTIIAAAEIAAAVMPDRAGDFRFAAGFAAGYAFDQHEDFDKAKEVSSEIAGEIATELQAALAILSALRSGDAA